MDEKRPEDRQAEEKAASARRKKAGALAAVLAGTWLAQLAAMVFSKPDKKDPKK